LHPLLAFQNIYNVLNDGGTVFYSGHILEYSYKIDRRMAKYKKELEAIVDKIPLTLFSRECHANVWSNWYIPNLLCLNDWLSTAGFEVFRQHVGEASSTMAGAAKKITNFRLAPKCYDCCWSDVRSHKLDMQGDKIIFFGAGGRFESLVDEIREAVPAGAILGVADNDSAKWGSAIAGYPILNPQVIRDMKPDRVIITSAYATDIFEELDDMKRDFNLDFEVVTIESSELLDMSSGHEVY